MKINGRITVVLPLENGTSAKGTAWSKQTAVVEESEGQYPQSLAFDMFGDKIVALTIGQQVEVDFDTKAREYQGKYFNNVNAWKITKAGEVTVTVATEAQPTSSQVDPSIAIPAGEAKDLPF